ncbi:hypothetical protein FJY71_03895 [candidate division WOR-3 bacterium]|nr:hypothetical protein [candidate division WOR-3 bacterium]
MPWATSRSPACAPTPLLVRAYALVRKAATRANSELGTIDRDKAALLAGGLADRFPVDVFQAAADACVGVAFTRVSELLAWLDTHSSRPECLAAARA